MKVSLVKLALVVGPLREWLEKILAGTRHTNQAIDNRFLREEGWTLEWAAALTAAKETLQNTVTLAYPRPE